MDFNTMDLTTLDTWLEQDAMSNNPASAETYAAAHQRLMQLEQEAWQLFVVHEWDCTCGCHPLPDECDCPECQAEMAEAATCLDRAIRACGATRMEAAALEELTPAAASTLHFFVY